MVAALYRRYRPETFAEMVGQQQVTEPLMTALRTGRINHAYLFSGPRGCGKTSSARILARCLNCAQGPTPTPCGECESCRELGRDGGGSLDVVEIDAASHGGVDDARDLRERAMTAPARDRYKIFIIDEAHMVTSAGFNALLKVVEEPPEEVLFLFATTEPEKVIGTIRSRTHHYPFRLIPPATMLGYIGEICTSEGVSAEPGVLPLVVRAGGGSARDTLSLLDQLIAGTDGDEIAYEMASQLLGFTSQGLLDATVNAIAGGNASEAIKSVDAVIQSGQDPRRFVEDLLERVRDLIVAKATGASIGAVLRGRSDDDLAALRDAAARFTPGQLSHIADLVNETLTEMSGVTAPRVQLELMVARVLVGMRASFADAEAAAALAVPDAAAVQPERDARTSRDSAASSRPAAATTRAESETPATPPVSAAATTPPSPETPATPPATETAPTRPAASGASTERESTAPAAEHGTAPSGAERTSARPARDAAPAKSTEAEPAVDAKTQATSAWAAASEPAAAATSAEPVEVDPSGIDLRRVTDVWPDVLEVVKREGGRPVWSIAQQIVPVSWEAGKLRVEFPNRGVFEQFKTGAAGHPAPGETLKAALHQVLGMTPTIYPRVRRGGAPDQSARPVPSTDDAERHRGRRDEPTAAPREQLGWNVAPIPSGPADDGPGSGWDELATATTEASEPTPAGEEARTIAPTPTDADNVGASDRAEVADTERAPDAPSTAAPTAEPERAPEIIAAREAAAHEAATAPEPLPPATVHVDDPAIASKVHNPVADPAASTAPSWSVAQVGPAPEPEPVPAPQVAEPVEVDPYALPEGVERYGEAVIREMLGARFVGEEPIVEPAAPAAADDFGPPPDDSDVPPEEY